MNHQVRRVVAAATCAVAGAAAAQSFTIESAVLDSRTSRNLGVSTERGAMAEFFKSQKAMTFGILRSAGISLDQLSPEVRARIERFQTTNVQAFRAFSEGLDLKDQGRFQEAKEAFRRAAEADPGFSLAVEQQQAMPDVNVTTALQMRAVVAAASTTAVDRGKAAVAVDLSRAVAALASGQSLVAIAAPASTEKPVVTPVTEYAANAPATASAFLPNLVAGLAYPYTQGTTTLGLGGVNEYKGDEYVAGNGLLEALESNGDLVARRAGATGAATGSALLSDGVTAVYWGTWTSVPGASAVVNVNGPAIAPALGTVEYMYGNATSQMPANGTAVFAPVGGSFGPGQASSGTISVNFGTRAVGINNLGFTLGGFAFSGLNGSATYSNAVASAPFSGNYTSGSCTGCPAFNPQAGVFGGNFVGRDANGVIFSTILPTGGSAPGTVSGVHLYGR